MDGIRSMEASSPLTKLYTDAKRSYQALSQQASTDDTPEMASLHRKSRMQKDRLIAWGLEWQDQNSTNGDSIDESVTRAGLGEAVGSIMDNIKHDIDDMDALCNSKKSVASPTGFPLEKASSSTNWSAADMQKYDELATNLTSSIDLLCDISQSKRMTDASEKSEKRSSYSKGGKGLAEQQFPEYPVQAPFTSFNSFKLDRKDLILPQETPPPYDNAGVEIPTRIVGRLKTAGATTDFRGNTHATTTVPVVVEYASYDSMYLETGVPLPYTRVEHFASLLGHETSTSSLLRLRGFFEDFPRPRIGFVYLLPAQVATNAPRSTLTPASLFDILRPVGRLNNYNVPPLEHRFRMALELCQGMKFLLDKGFSHRGLTSNSIFFLPKGAAGGSNASALNPATTFDLRHPAISSFDFFSEHNLEKMPESINQNMYRHPDDPRVKGVSQWAPQYTARFDLYSFGLILLEIGLWMPLSDIFKEKYSLADFRLRVGKIWVRKLPGKVTSAYEKAVSACLSATDGNFLQALDFAIRKLNLACLVEEDSDDETFRMTFDATDAELAGTSRGVADPTSPVRQESEAASPTDNTQYFGLDAAVTEAETPSATPLELKKCDCVVADSLKVFHEMAVSSELRQRCEVLLRQQITPIVERVLQKHREGCSIAVEMLGDSESNVRPYIHVVCKSSSKVYTYLKNLYQGSETYCDIAVSKGAIVRSKAQRTADTNIITRSAAHVGGKPAKNPDHQELPSCGASIGAYKNHGHLPPVSLGGLVMVDGQAYGMTVHHLLEDPDEEGEEDADEDLDEDGDQRSRIERPTEELSDDELDDDLLAELAAIKAGEVVMAEPDVDSTNGGDVVGIERGSGANIDITQPALDDVPADFYPDLEDRDEEHLLSYKLGRVHASSGLRRARKGEVEHEIDWLLLKLEDHRAQTSNVVPGGRIFCRNPSIDEPAQLREPVWRKQYKSSQDLYPRQVATSSELAGLAVHCYGRTSGLGCGKISTSMSSIKFPGREKFTQTWTVHGNFGHPGDSGAWVIDNKDGKVCGHVLGWSSRQGCAIIAPMDVTFEDMKESLKASHICLPGSREQQSSRRIMPTRVRGGLASRSSSSGSTEEGRRVRMMANHYLMSGSPGRMEREWNARRSALGSEQIQASS